MLTRRSWLRAKARDRHDGRSHTKVRKVLAATAVLMLASATMVASSMTPARAQQRVIEFNIPAQALGSALLSFGKQARVTVAFDNSVAAGVRAPGVSGRYTASEALDKLLAGTGLTFSFVDSSTVSVRRPAADRSGANGSENSDDSGSDAEPGSPPGTPGLGIEEVIVTAEKREAALQDVPLSITVMTGEDIVNKGISTIEEFSLFVPGLSLINDSMAIVYIRGIGTSAFGVATDPSTTVHYDGVYIPRPTTTYQDMFDIERIEVLRGPQGVLFGRNSTGGTLNIISKRPSDELEGALGFTYGNLDKTIFTGTVSGPIAGDKVGARISFLKNDRDGRFKNIDGRQFQDQNNVAFRGSLVFNPNEDIEFIIRGDYYREREGSFPTVPLNLGQDLIDAGATVVADITRQSALDADIFQDLDNYGISGTLTWDFGDLRFKSISAFRHSEYGVLIDVDSTDLFLRNVGFAEDSKSVSQELQLTTIGSQRLQWIFGLYYLHENGSDQLDIQEPARMLAIPETNKTNAYAVFGQAWYDITERLRATVGLRYSYEKKNFAFDVLAFGNNVAMAAASADWDALTPRFALDYAVNEDVMVYATATRGFKSGGFQLGDGKPFDPEFLWAYEVGTKATLLDRRLQANLGGFFYNFTDLQVVQFVNGIATTNNAGKARIKGFELEFLARPAVGWDVNVSIAFLDAQYLRFTEIVGGVEVDRRGNRLPSTPKWKASVGVQYQFVLDRLGYLTIRGDWAWQDSEFFKTSNDPLFAQGAFSILNARLAFETEDGLWEAALFARNITDKDFFTYKTTGVNAAGVSDSSRVIGVFGEPRLYGFQVKRSF